MGGSASRTISNNNTPDPGGGRRLSWKRPKDDTHGPRWTPDVQGFPVLGSLTPAESHRAPLGRLIKAFRRRMRPAGNGGSTRRMTSARRNDAGKRSATQPILAEAVEFSPASAQVRNEQAGRKTKSSRTGGISQTADFSPTQRATGCWKHRSRESSRDVEYSPGRHAFQQAG